MAEVVNVVMNIKGYARRHGPMFAAKNIKPLRNQNREFASPYQGKVTKIE